MPGISNYMYTFFVTCLSVEGVVSPGSLYRRKQEKFGGILTMKDVGNPSWIMAECMGLNLSNTFLVRWLLPLRDQELHWCCPCNVTAVMLTFVLVFHCRCSSCSSVSVVLFSRYVCTASPAHSYDWWTDVSDRTTLAMENSITMTN